VGQAQPISSASVAIWILACVAAAWFLREARDLLVPIALGILISYALEPIVRWLEARGVVRLLGAGLVMLMILAAIGIGAYTFRDDALDVVRTLPQAMERARQSVRDRIGISSEGLPNAAARDTPGQSERRSSGESGPAAQPTTNGFRVGSMLTIAGQLVVVFFLVFFLLISTTQVRERLFEFAGSNGAQGRTVAVVIDEINAQIQRYLLVLLVTAILVGAATWAVLAWQKVQHAAMWGLLAGLFNSIPYFGPVIVCGGLFAVGLAQGGGVAQAVLISGAALLITSLEGWLVTPALMGKAEKMSALVVFVGLVVWTWLWGEWGTILAVPMLAVIKSIADHVEVLKRFGRLMAP
jgi:predicted PurR-regulated permease PerM